MDEVMNRKTEKSATGNVMTMSVRYIGVFYVLSVCYIEKDAPNPQKYYIAFSIELVSYFTIIFP